MKKLLATTILTLGLTTSANALDKGLYAGMEFHNNTIELKDSSLTTASGPFNLKSDEYYETNYQSFVPVVGYQVTESTALELSYSSSEASKSNNSTGLVWTSGPVTGQNLNTKTETKLKILNLDSVHNIELVEPVRLLGVFGLSIIDIEVDEYYNDGSATSDSKLGFGFNLGVGIEADIASNLSLHTKLKYTKALSMKLKDVHATDGLESVTGLNIGIKYRF